MTPDTLHPNDSVSNIHTTFNTPPPPFDAYRTTSPSVYSQSTHTPHPYFAVPLSENQYQYYYPRDPSPYAPNSGYYSPPSPVQTVKSRTAPLDYEEHDPYKHPADNPTSTYFFNDGNNRLSNNDWFSTANKNRRGKSLGLLGLIPWFHGSKSKYPIEQQIEDRRRGIYRQRWPVMSVLIGIAIIVILGLQIARNKTETGKTFASGSLNPMGGPTAANLINQGARFRPCMTEVNNLNVNWPSIHDGGNPTTMTMPLYELCGFGMTSSETPNQSFRFVLPICEL